MKNKQNWIPIIGIASLVLCIVASISTRALDALSGPEMMMSGNPYVPDLPEITSDTQPMTLDEIARRFKRTFDEGMPGHYSAEMDEASFVYTVTTWSDGMDIDVPNAALQSLDQKKKWDADLEELRSLCNQMQGLVNAHGHPELDVIVRLVNCDNHDQLFAETRRGALTYDIVEATPAGERVEDPGRIISETGRYIVNRDTMKFHLPNCGYAEKISSNNSAVFTGDRAELIAMGYGPCEWCSP